MAHILFKKISSLENLFGAWREFQRDKMQKSDVLEFAQKAEHHLLKLHQDLINYRYRHGQYIRFYVNDPKQREISKACVRDRVLHHAICRVLTPIFEPRFIFDSYSSRKGKGTLAATERFEKFAWTLSQNNTKTVWVLKCDIKKFFDSIDHEILIKTISKNLPCQDTLSLLRNIIESFEVKSKKGLPLGNLTSQLLSNVYLDRLDQFVKREPRVKYYIRYADDILILDRDKRVLEEVFLQMSEFVQDNLQIKFHDHKTTFQKWHNGIDVLGYISFPYHRVMRTKTVKRIFRRLEKAEGKLPVEKLRSVVASYLGRLKHCRGKKLGGKVREYF
ncbi:MAG: group II intron reverse transcriptase domain-containing protein [Candidatus Vogelbacteria bacterium]|nr:group II intron reverse transcriptase domain-containing protein [Candidatus Vogelbacteria bacterium]